MGHSESWEISENAGFERFGEIFKCGEKRESLLSLEDSGVGELRDWGIRKLGERWGKSFFVARIDIPSNPVGFGRSRDFRAWEIRETRAFRENRFMWQTFHITAYQEIRGFVEKASGTSTLKNWKARRLGDSGYWKIRETGSRGR